MKRVNELKYIRRQYIFPFKPMLDWEYRKLGFKKCDIGKTDSKIFRTVYYVKHRETPMPALYWLCYVLNSLFSWIRCIVYPLCLALFLFSIIIEQFFDVFLIEYALALLIYLLPVFLINFILTLLAAKSYDDNDVLGKTDRALTSHGWAPWSSYVDNDSRFDPPIKRPTSTMQNAPRKNSGNNQQKKTNGGGSAGYNNLVASPDQYADDGVITLLSANGEEIDFTEIAAIAHKGKFYAILQPIELLDGMGDDEALVFEVVRLENGEDKFEICLDDDIIDAVFDEYDRLYEEAHS